MNNFKDEDIDPEILEIVKNFNKAGIKTIYSCQGHFKESVDGGGMSMPYLWTEIPESHKIYEYLCKFNFKMIDMKIVHNYPVYEYEFTSSDNCIEILDNIISKMKNTNHLEFTWNNLIYNLPEKVYNNSELYESVFEHLRKKFLEELLQLSKELLYIIILLFQMFIFVKVY